VTISRSTPLQRSSPLRSTRMKRKPPRRLSRPGADPAYVSWLHARPCVGPKVDSFHRCCGRLEQSHLRSTTGMGRKEPDKRSVPMCSVLHREWEEHTGVFAGMSKSDRLAWMILRIAEEHLAYQLGGGVLA
jgi:hypothetical protein